jgi:hypothetical protein
MQNPIQHSNLFITPASLDELLLIAESMDNTAQAMQMVMFTLNYCHDLVEAQREEAHH